MQDLADTSISHDTRPAARETGAIGAPTAGRTWRGRSRGVAGLDSRAGELFAIGHDPQESAGVEQQSHGRSSAGQSFSSSGAVGSS